MFITLTFPKWQIFRLKAFADDKINETEKLKFVLGTGENIVGKGENAGNQHFFLYPQCFQKGLLYRVLKSRDCVVTVRVKSIRLENLTTDKPFSFSFIRALIGLFHIVGYYQCKREMKPYVE